METTIVVVANVIAGITVSTVTIANIIS